MGCCQSRQRKQVTNKKVTQSVVHTKVISTAKAENPQSLQGHVSSAGWKTDSNFGDYVQIVEGENRTIFACLFDPHTTPDAAKFCGNRCHDIFQEAMLSCNKNPRTALEQTFKELDQQFLTFSLNPLVRAISGCSGVIVYIDTTSKKCWVGNIGTCQCLIGVSEGAFNARYMDGRVLVDRHNAENPIEQDGMRKKFPEQKNLLQIVNGSTLLKGVTNVVSCIGFGFAKDAKLASLYNKTASARITPLPSKDHPYVASTPQVEVCDLSRGVETMILYSEGMANLISPSEMAIFAMHFEHSSLTPFGAYIAEDSTTPTFPVPALQCQAAALIRHAVSHAAGNVSLQKHASQRIDTRGRKDSRKTFDDPNGGVGLVKIKQQGYPKHSGSAFKKNANENLACVVISLEPGEETNINTPRSINSPPSKARIRWKLIQRYCKFYIQCRRACRQHWWQLISLAVRDAQQKALESEKAQWMRVKNGTNGMAFVSTDQETQIENTDPTERVILHSKWLDAPSHKGKYGLISSHGLASNKAIQL